jgi:cytochrome P450
LPGDERDEDEEAVLEAKFPFTTPPQLDHDPEAIALLEQGPVIKASMGPMEVWLALSHKAVRQVLGDPRFSREAATRPGGPVKTPVAANPLLITSMEGKRHARVRRLMSQAFSPRMIERLEPRVQSIVDSLLDELESPADLTVGLTTPLPTMVICELLGAPYSDAPAIRAWSTQLFSMVITPEELQATQEGIQGYLAGLVEQKRAEPDDALISAMVAANDEGDHLTQAELLANLQGLLIAGHDTTVHQLGNSFVTLFRHPKQLKLLRDDPALAGRAVDELMRFTRLFSAAEPRVTTELVDLEGTLLDADVAVLPVITSANRDPDAYPDPHTFDITRQNPAPHLGFGHGPHFCLGTQLARLELRVALASTLKRFPGLRLTVDPDDLTYQPGHALRALDVLPVEW